MQQKVLMTSKVEKVARLWMTCNGSSRKRYAALWVLVIWRKARWILIHFYNFFSQTRLQSKTSQQEGVRGALNRLPSGEEAANSP